MLLKALNMIRQCHRRSFWLRVLYVVLQSLLPLVNLYILKLLVDTVTTPGVTSVAIFNFHLSTLNLVILPDPQHPQ